MPIVIVLSGLLLRATSVAAIDLSGIYVGRLDVLPAPCTLTFTQQGSALAVSGPCTFGSTYTFDLAGTADSVTGAFTVSGRLLGLCDDPGSTTMTGTGDGSTFTGVAQCGVASAISGTKCGNGMLDPGEECEDGNAVDGDCCSSACRVDTAGTPCAADTDACTVDACDGAGRCAHLPDPIAGRPCPDDGSTCTDDVCDAAGTCTHPPRSGACDDDNACTTADACDAGACTGGTIVPECVGPLDLTGDWLVEPTSPGGAFLGTGVRRFAQTGAVLRSSVIGGTAAVGSVNPATGAFESHTPTVILIFSCLETIRAVATPDGQLFSGTLSANCGLEGTIGPINVVGRRCPAGGCNVDPCAPAGMFCRLADQAKKLSARLRQGRLPVRWRWQHGEPVPIGDPKAGTTYRLCLRTPAGTWTDVVSSPGWRPRRGGFQFHASGGAVRRLELRQGAGGTRVAATVVLPAGPGLPWTLPVHVRLLQSGGGTPVCQEATFVGPDVNTATSFRATR